MKKLINNLLSNLPTETRQLDIELIKSFISNNDENVIQALKDYQNEDGGFGHGLEADTTLPDSSVVNTDMAVTILEHLKHSKAKTDLIKAIIAYYETEYIHDINGWKMIPKTVNNYPRAIWWNYESLDSFPWQNPNLEIIGFLNQYKVYVTNLDVDFLTNLAIRKTLELTTENCSMHTLLSAVRFYERCDQKVKDSIFNHLNDLVNKLVTFESKKWNEYALEPYKVLSISKDFMKDQEDVIKINIASIEKLLNESYPLPKWNWFQFEEVFRKQKYQWIGNLSFEMLQALSNYY
jgi:hypothetical protein